MVRQECDELLADHAGRAKNAYGNSRHVCTALLQKKSRHGQTVSAGFSSDWTNSTSMLNTCDHASRMSTNAVFSTIWMMRFSVAVKSRVDGQILEVH